MRYWYFRVSSIVLLSLLATVVARADLLLTLETLDPWSIDLGDEVFDISLGQSLWGTVPFEGDKDRRVDYSNFAFTLVPSGGGDAFSGTGYINIYGIGDSITAVLLNFGDNALSGSYRPLTITGSSLTTQAFDNLGDFSLSFSGSSGPTMQVTAIPEPAETVTLLGVVALALVSWVRFRRKRIAANP